MLFKKCNFDKIAINEIISDKISTLIGDSLLRNNLLKKADLKLDDLIVEACSHAASARFHLAEYEGTIGVSTKAHKVRAPRGQSPGMS